MKPQVPFVAARKMGMTTLFDAEGRRRGVTLLQVLPMRVVAVRAAGQTGHDSMQLGYGDVPLSAGAMGPARIWPGQKMPGRHGNNPIELRNCVVVEVDLERGLVAVEGGVPGARGAMVHLYPTAERFAAWLEERDSSAESPGHDPSEGDGEEAAVDAGPVAADAATGEGEGSE